MPLNTSQISSVVTPSSSPPISIFQYTNPEIVLPPLILEYLNKLDFNNIMPNFKRVRVSAEHPFITFLYNDQAGAKYDFNVLPSITVTDSQDEETMDTLGIGYEPQTVDSKYVSQLSSQIFNPSTNDGYLVVSQDNMTRLQNAVANNLIVGGTKHFYTARHTVELNIWADNKNATSILYSAVESFLMSYIDRMIEESINFQSISGHRSGDINLDYGRILFGSNITFSCFIREVVVEVDLNITTLKNINENPTFHEAK